MHAALLTLGFGIVTASILALSAVAFTLEYAVTNVANVSHGEILTVGAYAAYLVHQRTGSALAAAIAAAAGRRADCAGDVLERHRPVHPVRRQSHGRSSSPRSACRS